MKISPREIYRYLNGVWDASCRSGLSDIQFIQRSINDALRKYMCWIKKSNSKWRKTVVMIRNIDPHIDPHIDPVLRSYVTYEYIFYSCLWKGTLALLHFAWNNRFIKNEQMYLEMSFEKKYYVINICSVKCYLCTHVKCYHGFDIVCTIYMRVP